MTAGASRLQRYSKKMNKTRRNSRQAAYAGKRRSREVVKRRVSMGSGFPKMLNTKLHYVDNDNIITSLAAGTTGTYQYVINGMYDFDYTGTGHQPFYFDQYAQIYNHYVVTGAKITIAWVNPSASDVVVGGYINDDVAIQASTLNMFCEEPESQFRVIPANQSEPVYMTFYWSAAKFFTGRKDNVLADNSLQGTSSGNPSELSILSLFYRNHDVTASTTIRWTIRAEFSVIWKELRDITGS